MTMWGIDDARFARLDDSACHQACIDDWIYRDDFLEYYNRCCKNELFINRAGHVDYRFDYVTWIMNAVVLTLGILFLLPSFALLEFSPRNLAVRVALFLTPLALLASFAWTFSASTSFPALLLYATILWLIASACSFAIVVNMPIRGG